LAATEREEAPSLLVSPFRAIASFVGQKLDGSLDTSLRSFLRQDLPVATLQRKGCSPDALLKELGTRLMDTLIDETHYSAEQLRTLGFTWKSYLEAGLSPKHIAKARERFQGSLFSVIIATPQNLSDLCSGDINRMIALKLTAQEWKSLCPNPASSLHQLGFQANHLMALGYSLQEWDEIMGLDMKCIRMLYKFDPQDYLQFIQFDSELKDEFVHRFKFDPYRQVFGASEHGRGRVLHTRRS
jgi:hypothetical protein